MKSRVLGQASTSELAQPVIYTGPKILTVEQVAETDTSGAITAYIAPDESETPVAGSGKAWRAPREYPQRARLRTLFTADEFAQLAARPGPVRGSATSAAVVDLFNQIKAEPGPVVAQMRPMQEEAEIWYRGASRRGVPSHARLVFILREAA